MQNMLLTPHFALLEFTESATAKKRGIDNEPQPEAVVNLMRLCLNTLEPLREAIGLPVVITSGYRCQRLNDIISHSSKRSQHMQGQAADFYIGWSQGRRGGSKAQAPSHRVRLIKAFRLILTCEQIDYDQLILYPNFIHVSYVSNERNRHAILIGRNDGKLGYGRISLKNALTIS